jgi:uroporphyrinogen-III synthase
MSRLVLITRDIEQAKDFAVDIQSIGATPLIQPLLDIHYTNIDLQRLKRPSAIVLTSQHAMKGREFPPLSG